MARLPHFVPQSFLRQPSLNEGAGVSRLVVATVHAVVSWEAAPQPVDALAAGRLYGWTALQDVVDVPDEVHGRPARPCGFSEAIDRCTGTRYNPAMIRSFRHRGLRRLYERDDPSRIGADQLDRTTLALADLDAASKPSELDLPGYRLHPLTGERKGLWSISISGNWRITFRFEDGDVYDIDLVDYH